MPEPLDQTDAQIADYQDVFLARVDKAAQEIDTAFERLRAADRAKPSTWFAMLRDAERSYRRAFPRNTDAEDAKAFIRRIETKQVEGVNEAKPDTAPKAFGLTLDQRSEMLKDQIDAMRVLIDDYLDRLKDDPPTDDNGFIAAAALGGTIAAAHGIFKRRAKFYGRDQAGRIYSDVTKTAARQAGAHSYEWLRTTSANPRDRHLRRVGQIFEYGEVPDEPGDLPNCKCGEKPIWR